MLRLSYCSLCKKLFGCRVLTHSHNIMVVKETLAALALGGVFCSFVSKSMLMILQSGRCVTRLWAEKEFHAVCMHLCRAFETCKACKVQKPLSLFPELWWHEELVKGSFLVFFQEKKYNDQSIKNNSVTSSLIAHGFLPRKIWIAKGCMFFATGFAEKNDSFGEP